MITTAIAYILTIIIASTFSSFGKALFTFIATPIKKIGLKPFFISTLVSALSTFAATWVGTLIFDWLNKEPGLFMLIAICIVLLIKNINRIVFNNVIEFELGFLVGDISGIMLAGGLFVLAFNPFNTVLYTIIAVIIIYYIFIKFGNMKFWNTVRLNPEIAYEHFLKSEYWSVIDGINDGNQPSIKSGKWVGPFTFDVPSINRSIKVYGKSDFIEQDEKMFLEIMNKYEHDY